MNFCGEVKKNSITQCNKYFTTRILPVVVQNFGQQFGIIKYQNKCKICIGFSKTYHRQSYDGILVEVDPGKDGNSAADHTYSKDYQPTTVSLCLIYQNKKLKCFSFDITVDNLVDKINLLT